MTTNVSIFEKVIEAFQRVEVTDNKVDRILMPKRAFQLLGKEAQKKEIGPLFLQMCQDPSIGEGTENGDGYTLWGAEIEISNKFEVQSKGWIARNATTNEEILELSGPFITEPVDYKIFGSAFDIIVRKRGAALNLGKLSPEERVAIETLREMISEREFRRYMRDRFLLVQGASGRVYQIFRNGWHTKVWDKGRIVQEVCVRIDNFEGVPPTDNVIAFLQIILIDESEFLKLGNVYNLQKQRAA